MSTIALVLVVLLRLYAQSYALHGSREALNPALVLSLLTGTSWGIAWLLQLIGVIVALIGFIFLVRRQAGWTIATLGALILAFTPALSGHALSVPNLTALSVFADGVHVISAAGWFGSLLFVITAGIPAAMSLESGIRNSVIADFVSSFSPTALVFAVLLSITGTFSAWLHLGTIPALWQTQYGKILLLKLGLLSLVVGTGAYNWLKVKPALVKNLTGAQQLKRSATVELVIAVLVLAVTAVLVATPTGIE